MSLYFSVDANKVANVLKIDSSQARKEQLHQINKLEERMIALDH
jgi:hypothetical protein